MCNIQSMLYKHIWTLAKSSYFVSHFKCVFTTFCRKPISSMGHLNNKSCHGMIIILPAKSLHLLSYLVHASISIFRWNVTKIIPLRHGSQRLSSRNFTVHILSVWFLGFPEKYELVGRLLKPGEEPTNYSDEEQDDTDNSTATTDKKED